jgi:hypothetical protein
MVLARARHTPAVHKVVGRLWSASERHQHEATAAG